MLLRRLLLALVAFCALTAPLAAQRGRTHVRGYTRRDGTQVAPYTRSAPHSRSYTTPKPRSHSYAAPSHPRRYSAPRAQPAPPVRSHPRASTNSHGRIPRSREAKDQFLRRTGYPHGRPGYVVDHIVPLCAGGADAPSNMQWQTVEEAKVKDRQERAECSKH